jgi:hypothetical protein
VIGSVFLRVDWSVPVEDLRVELYRALKEHPLWDQRDWTLQVTDITDSGMVVLRALMSAADSPSAWDLRCDMREHLVTYIRENYPDALPRLRIANVADPAPGKRPSRGKGGPPSARPEWRNSGAPGLADQAGAAAPAGSPGLADLTGSAGSGGSAGPAGSDEDTLP